jgi:hypothetical protein
MARRVIRGNLVSFDSKFGNEGVVNDVNFGSGHLQRVGAKA